MGVLEPQDVKLSALPWGMFAGAALSGDDVSATPHTTQGLRCSADPQPPASSTAAHSKHQCTCKEGLPQ